MKMFTTCAADERLQTELTIREKYKAREMAADIDRQIKALNFKRQEILRAANLPWKRKTQ